MAADYGLEGSICKCAQMLQDGIGCKRDPKYALYYAKKCMIDNRFLYNQWLYTGRGVSQSNKGVEYFKKSKEKGKDAEAINYYGMMLFNGDYFPLNEKEAASCFEKIKFKNCKGMCNYAIFLLNGVGIEQDVNAASLYINRAIKEGDAYSMHIYVTYFNEEKDPKEVTQYYKREMEKGDLYAKTLYAFNLNSGNGITQNVDDAEILFEELVKSEFAFGMFIYAYALLSDEGIRINEKKAEEMLELSFKYKCYNLYPYYFDLLVQFPEKMAINIFKKAIDQGIGIAMRYYSNYLINKDGDYANKEELFNILGKAIEKGDVVSLDTYVSLINKESDTKIKDEALKNIENLVLLHASTIVSYANMLLEGNGCIQKDKISGIAFLQVAAEGGDPETMYRCTEVLCDCKFMEGDRSQATKYLYKLVDMNAYPYTTLAMKKLAKMLYEGDGIKEDKKKALEYLEKLVKLGDPDSMLQFAIILYNGNGIREDKDQAYQLFEGAAMGENPIALGNYAQILFDEGMRDEAIEAYEASINMENADSMREYAIILIEGKNGVLKNTTQAAQLFEKAIENGKEEDLISMYYYSELLRNGNGCEKDVKKADEYIKKVNNKSADDLFKRGLELYEGKEYGPLDKKTGTRYINLAAIRGNKKAKAYCKEHEI